MRLCDVEGKGPSEEAVLISRLEEMELEEKRRFSLSCISPGNAKPNQNHSCCRRIGSKVLVEGSVPRVSHRARLGSASLTKTPHSVALPQLKPPGEEHSQSHNSLL